MNTINFYDERRSLIMHFSNFKNEDKYEYPHTISFTCNINFECFHIKTKILMEKDELDSFVSIFNLQKKFDYRWTPFFCPAPSPLHPLPFLTDISIDFNLIDNENIEVKCEISDVLANNTLTRYRMKFDYLTKPSFLPELIKEIEDVLQQLKNGW